VYDNGGEVYLARKSLFSISAQLAESQVARIAHDKLIILSASDPSTAEIFLPPRSDTKIAHLSCVSGHLARRIDDGGRLFSNLKNDKSTRYVAFHVFDTEQCYWGFFPRSWRPGDSYSNPPFSIKQPEILGEYLLTVARGR